MTDVGAEIIDFSAAQPASLTPRAIDKITAAFAMKPWVLEVPEWPETDGSPMKLYFLPLTMDDIAQVGLGIRESQDKVEQELRLIILKARDKDGRPIFATGDLYALRTQTRADVIQRIVAFMFACGAMKVGEARDAMGNSSGSATSSSSPSTSE